MRMLQLDPQYIASRLTEYYGLPLLGNKGLEEDGHQYIELYPDGVHSNDGFCVRITIGWRSLRGEFLPGPFAAPMIQHMGKAPPESKAVFSGFAKRMREENGVIQMQVNDLDVDPERPDSWPNHWGRLKLAFEKSPLAVNTEDNQDTQNALLHWGGRFLAGILALIPLEETETEDNVNPEGLPEGARLRVEVNKYERNRFNRAACIEIHGAACKACGFDFGEVYGELGRGFIHVHHIIPVSEMGEGYRVNPATDLVPLCPNCHAMVHRTKPPLSIQDIVNILGRQPG